jgi:hypothetical protein
MDRIKTNLLVSTQPSTINCILGPVQPMRQTMRGVTHSTKGLKRCLEGQRQQQQHRGREKKMINFSTQLLSRENLT